MPIDPKFVINLKGKQFVMLGGLLDLAHNGGLIGIETVLQENLSDPKEQSYVFQAIGRFRSEVGEAIWSAYGDASPANSQMKGATLRHAETRAIARMLRMATNVAMCSVEELGPDGTDQETEGNGQSSGAYRSQRSQPPAGRPAQPRPALDKDTGPVRPAARPVVEPEAGEDAEPVVCEVCEQPLTPKAVTACMDHPELFDGKMLCAEHRKDYRDRVELGARAKVPSGILA